MAGPTIALNQRVRNDDPLISENIRKFINRRTLWTFTPEARHQIALLEEQLYSLKKERQAILRKESELTYLLHDLILQEKYIQLVNELRDLAVLADEAKTDEQRERELVIDAGMKKINESRDLMFKDMDIERLREQEEDGERFEEFLKMQQEWEEMKMPGVSDKPPPSSSGVDVENGLPSSDGRKASNKLRDCIIF